MSKKSGFSRFYQNLSSRLLNVAMTPHLLASIPASLHTTPVTQDASALPTTPLNGEPVTSDTESTIPRERPVCYVLLRQSRTTALLVDSEARKQHLPPALEPMDSYRLNEEASVIFLEGNQEVLPFTEPKHPFSPRLVRLIEAIHHNPELDIELIPVTVLWGRSPDKEDSWFKLLVADSWAPPSGLKQLVNIGVHGRQTYLQFHEPVSLRGLCEEGERQLPGLNEAAFVSQHLSAYLARQREVVLGPDLSDRRNIVHQLMQSPAVQEAIQSETIRNNLTIEAATLQAKGYLEEIVSDYNSSAVRFLELTLNWLWNQLYDGVEVHHFQTVRDHAEDYELVYTPCHRSHIDYLLLSFVIYTRGLMVPYIAAGDNLNIPLVGPLLRRGGAFFIRRSFKGNPLYISVFKEYLHSILTRNTPLEYFIEGGRSRTGRLLPPKTGMLAMTIQSQLRGAGKPIAFIPTYIGYERLMEGGTYIGEMQGKPKEAESVFGLLKAARKIERIFGKVYVSFGEPVILDQALRAHGVESDSLTNPQDALSPAASQAVQAVADQILQNINRAAVVNPVSLLSLVLLSTPKHALDEAVCIKQLDVYRSLVEIAPYDERIEITTLSGQEIIQYGLKLKLIKRVAHVLGDMIAIADNQAVLLTYFRNNILHLYSISSLIAALVQHNGKITRAEIYSVIQALYPFLQAELFLKWPADAIQSVVDRELEALIQVELVLDDGRDGLYSPPPNSESYNQLGVLAAPVLQSMERYFMTFCLLSQRGSGRITAKQVEDLSHLLGQRLSILYEFSSPEFFDKSLFRSFVEALAEHKYIQLDDQGLIHFDHRLQEMAEDARLVLNAETLNAIQHMTNVSEEEVEKALTTLDKKKEKRKKG